MFLNNLCTDPDCLQARGCQHLGPRGQHCFFEVEKALCELLHIPWKQDLSLKQLIAEVRYRFTGQEALTEDLPISLRSTDDIVKDLEEKLKVVK